MTVAAFTRARIARLCADALRESGALGVVPTPLDAVLETVGVRDRVELARIPERPAVAERLLGAVWFEERALFVDRRQSEPRRRFTEAHEAVHLLCPWHAAVLRVDTAAELFGPLARGIEAEANFGAGQLIFQGGSFHAESLEGEHSLRTPFALAGRFGASHHAAAHHYVEGHPEPVALLVAGRWPGADGALPVWRSIESASFLKRFGRLATCLPGGRLAARDGPGAPLAGAIDEARRSSEPAATALWLRDRGGRRRRLRAEVFNNRHCHLVFVAEATAAVPLRPMSLGRAVGL
jgi:hypothetical protein